jgi:hypothetical protein
MMIEPGDAVPGDNPVTANFVIGEARQKQGNFGGRWTPTRRIDDHHSIQAASDMLGKWCGVTVIGMDTRRPGLDLVCCRTACGNRLPPVVLGAMGTVEVQTVGMCSAVFEMDPEQVTLVGADYWRRNSAVVGPRLKMDSGTNLE